MMTRAWRKPLNRKAYGSIGHLPGSRLGEGDHHVHDGQARICCEKVRDKHDIVIVTEKLDGSCMAVAKLPSGDIVPLTRSGWPTWSSPYAQHHMFAEWVLRREEVFERMLLNGERIVGEWLAQAHGTKYYIAPIDNPISLFSPFDIFTEDNQRLLHDERIDRMSYGEPDIASPRLLFRGSRACSVEDMQQVLRLRPPRLADPDPPEGAVWRVERKGKVDFLAKWVRQDKIDGKYLPEVSGEEAIWNWLPEYAKLTADIGTE